MLKIRFILSGLLLLSTFLFTLDVSAQWKSQGALYHDKFVSVDIEYLIPSSSCVTDSLVRYRYKITHLDKKHLNYYINWRLDYFDCDYQQQTRNNNLYIGKETKLGIFDGGEGFNSVRLSNYFYDVKVAAKRILRKKSELVYNFSIEPKGITGEHNLNSGAETELSIVGGYLAPGAIWKWYENTVNGNSIGEGPSINVKPSHDATFFVRGEGQYKSRPISIDIKVADINSAADRIRGKDLICKGEKNIELIVVGGHLAKDSKWVWYKNACGTDKIGEGAVIAVSPDLTTNYFVRAEGPSSTSTCQSHLISVSNMPANVNFTAPQTVEMGESFDLRVINAEPESGFKYVWYIDYGNGRMKIGEGSSTHISSFRLKSVYYSVRAEGQCANSSYASQVVQVKNVKHKVSNVSHHVAAGRNKFFVNFGIVDNNLQEIKEISNVSLMVGRGENIGWYVRGKMSIKSEKKSFEAYNDQISNYDVPGYYNYNASIISKRSAATGGIYLGGKHLAIYLGGGYGRRDLLYGINQYQYNRMQIVDSYVRMNEASYQGYEVEGGLILKAGPINLIGGVSSIEFKYIDCSVGIGFNL